MKYPFPSKKQLLPSLLTGGLFALFTVSGQIHDEYPAGLMLLSAIGLFLFYTILFTCLICVLLQLGARLSAAFPGPAARVMPFWPRRRGRRAALIFLLFILAYTPSFLAVCPGIFGFDGPDQIFNTLHPDGVVTTHHPLIHSYLLAACFRLGHMLTGGYEWGLLLYSLLQWFLSAAVFTCLFLWMEQRNTPVWIQALSFLYLTLNPFFHCLMFSTTKDTISGAFFLLLFMKMVDLAVHPENFSDISGRPGQYVIFLIAAIGMSLFRKPGYYILAFSFLIFLIMLPRSRRAALLTLGVSALLSWFLMQPLTELLGIPQGDAREMLSLPMQQLAAVWQNCVHGQITLAPEEMADIEALILPEALAGYLPFISDPVKAGFQTEVLKASLGHYAGLYLHLGLRFPKIYLTAFRDMLSGYWILGSESSFLSLLYTDVPYAPLAGFCEIRRFNLFPAFWDLLKKSVDYFGTHPVLTAAAGQTLPVWLMFAAMIRGACLRRPDQTAACSLLFGQWGILLLSPAVLIRYAYPMMLCVPVMLALLFEQEQPDMARPIA